MKKLYNLMACGIALFAAIPAMAQQGYMFSRYRSYNEEMPIFSSLNNGYGTARSIALGGAYTSLGADLSSMAINPAGLGMYQSSEFGLSTNLSISQHRNTGPLLFSGKGDNKTSFALNNVGLALNLYEGLGDVTSFTFGFSYNRLADFNYKSNVTMRPDNLSIGELFAYQLFGIYKDWIAPDRRPSAWRDEGFYPNEWGAILGYQTGLVGVFAEPESDDWKYLPTDFPGAPWNFANKYDELRNRTYYLRGADIWGETANTIVGKTMRTESKGGTGEYNVAGGFNLRGKTYLGFSLGMQDIYRKQTVMYTESYLNNEGAEAPASAMSYSQHTRVSGSGFNFKIGAITNPIAGLRIGVAFHSPTWNTINKQYSAGMHTAFVNGGLKWAETDTYEYEYKYSTHARLLTGASYTFGTKGLISVDYECDFYNWMRMRVPNSERYYTDENGMPRDEFEDLKSSVKKTYKPRHVIRLGGEYKPTPALALRAGFAYHGSFLKDNTLTLDDGSTFKAHEQIYNEPLPYKSFNISGGIGYRFSNAFSLDLAYVFMKTNYTPYELFYYNGYTNKINVTSTDPLEYQREGMTIDYGMKNGIKSTLKNHNIVLSFNTRF